MVFQIIMLNGYSSGSKIALQLIGLYKQVADTLKSYIDEFSGESTPSCSSTFGSTFLVNTPKQQPGE